MNPLLQNLQALLVPALLDRLVLALNHVLAQEPLATARLAPHAGRVMQLELLGLPRPLPQVPPLALRVTPAGLVENAAPSTASGTDTADSVVDLRVKLAAEQPAALALQWLGGQMPPLTIEGDAQLAADVDWLLKNLRWDMADDLQQLFGPAVAQQLHGLGSTLAQGLRAALQGLAAAASQLRGGR